MAGFLSDVDDFVNEKIPGGWYSIAAMLGGAGYGMNGGFGSGAGAGSTGFSFLPSGEMTVFAPEATAATSASSPSWLSSLFTQAPAPMGTDYSRQVQMYPTSSGNIFEPSGMSAGQLDQLNMQGMLSNLQTSGNQRPWELDALKMLTQQQPQQEKEEPMAQLKKGVIVPQAVLSSLLDPQSAIKAYRPTLI